MEFKLKLTRNDNLEGFGAFFSPEEKDVDEPNEIFINVKAHFNGNLINEDGEQVDFSDYNKVQMLIATLMHEFGHALEDEFGIDSDEDFIEEVCTKWAEEKYK